MDQRTGITPISSANPATGTAGFAAPTRFEDPKSERYSISNSTKRNVLLVCLIIAPLFQLIGDALWVTKEYAFSWSVWREASYVFFVPVGILLAKMVEQRSTGWAITCCAFFITGCFGTATMMPLFRLGAFYPTNGGNEFPAIVQSVLGEGFFALTIYPPGLCFPVSLVLFGIAFLKYRLLNTFFGMALILSGLFFWFGNAVGLNLLLLAGDSWLLLTLAYLAFTIYSDSKVQQKV
ncbi:hypothetical protein [Pontibacter korlensis]|nr:hypothetical protein [Pontibacter korlensis]